MTVTCQPRNANARAQLTPAIPAPITIAVLACSERRVVLRLSHDNEAEVLLVIVAVVMLRLKPKPFCLITTKPAASSVRFTTPAAL